MLARSRNISEDLDFKCGGLCLDHEVEYDCLSRTQLVEASWLN